VAPGTPLKGNITMQFVIEIPDHVEQHIKSLRRENAKLRVRAKQDRADAEALRAELEALRARDDV
jgi:hypothetical protein